ncbi:hypothetical protein V8B97DRAFT_1867617 [Scleroderma yunnanense]
MDELTAARAELNRLDKQEQEILEQLLAVRSAAQAQRTKIEELVKQIPAPVDRLPNELLLQIMEFSIQIAAASCKSCDAQLGWKRALTTVSRRWRDLILHSPSLWSTIKVTPIWHESLVEGHVTNSCQYPLDIEICSWPDTESQHRLTSLLGIVTPCAHRWRSLAIRRDVSESHRSHVLEVLDGMTFPTLTYVSMLCLLPSLIRASGDRIDYTAQIFTREKSPQLKSLELGGPFVTRSAFQLPPDLVTLDLVFDDPFCEDPSLFLGQLSCCTLTSLSLSGELSTLDRLHPNSIQFPLLETFVCTLQSAQGLMHALVAPILNHFEYRPSLWEESPDDVFAGLNNKFSSVIHLILSGMDPLGDVKAIYLAFPNVRHLVLGPNDLTPIFRPTDSPTPEFTWHHLERLTVDGQPPIRGNSIVPDALVGWLKQRQRTTRSKLRVKLCSVYATGDWRRLWNLYEVLHEYCILEWAGVPLDMSMNLFGTGDSPLLVCMQTFYTT